MNTVDKKVLKGQLKGNGFLWNGNTKTAKYSWIGKINRDNIPEYELVITDKL